MTGRSRGIEAGYYRVDVLAFRGRLDRVGFVVTPLVNLVMVAAFVGLAFMAKRHLLPEAFGARLVASAITLSVVETMASFVSVQVRRLRDAGFSGWHAAWIFAVPPILAQASPPVGAAFAMAANLAFLAWPSGPAGSGDRDPTRLADVGR